MPDNPFAFPVPIGAQSRGMTLRDQAALAALQGLAAHTGSSGLGFGPGELAERAWQLALAWEAERERINSEATP